MDVCRKIVTMSGLDIDMSFGMNKCEVIHSVKRKIIRSLFIHEIPKLSGENSNKYLRLLECSNTIQSDVKEGVQKEYVGIIEKILMAEVSSMNELSAVRAFAMTVI